MTQPPTVDAREARMPLFVQVVTQPPVHDCWAVNISASGIGLVVGRGSAEAVAAEGTELALELQLPDSGSMIRARGDVVWRHETPGGHGESGVAIGVRFTWVPGPDRAELKRYLQDYRFHVAVAFAVGEEKRLAREALEANTRIHDADSVAALRDLLSRGDIAVVLACGSDQALLRAAVQQAHGEEPEGAGPAGFMGPPRDLAARIIHFGRTDPDALIELFNAGKLHRALRPPSTPAELRDLVLLACSEYGHRTEQRRHAQALERALMREGARTRTSGQLDRLVDARMIHASKEMDRVLRLVRTVAPHKVGVLIQGETGTGKEILARTIHELSDRAQAPFVIQDCGALPETLLESELFGHVKGAFTGATTDHPGLFVRADGGTIFLDEIENTTPNLQAKLLRAIETGAIRPVGGSRVRQVDVRIVAASNRDLQAEIDAGRFRADLFYRLNTFVIDVPPLRRRLGDLPVLARHFLERANEALGRSAVGLSERALSALRDYPWPGNIRELKNVIERAVLLSEPGEIIGPGRFPDAVAGTAADVPAGAAKDLRARLAEAERALIEEALARHAGVLRRAARELGVNAVTLGRRAKSLGLR